MFPARYFAPRYWTRPYWAEVGQDPPPLPILILPQPPDSLLYPYTVGIWRSTVHLGGDGQPSSPELTWRQVAAGQIFYAELKANRHAAAAFLQMEDDGTDAFHFPAAADIQALDVLQLVSYPNPRLVGLYWRVRGDPENHDFIAGKQIVPAHPTAKPDGIT